MRKEQKLDKQSKIDAKNKAIRAKSKFATRKWQITSPAVIVMDSPTPSPERLVVFNYRRVTD